MARNIEIKARIDNIESVYERALALADAGPETITQDDTFFFCDNGRLKLRTFSAEKGELIFYRRPDQKGLKESFYCISPIMDPASLREALTLAYGQAGRVRKTRTLFQAGRTRIHLDRVEGLGEFLELEVMLKEGQDAETAKAIAQALMQKLGIRPQQLIEGAYVDLLTGTEKSGVALDEYTGNAASTAEENAQRKAVLLSGVISWAKCIKTKKGHTMALAEAIVEGNKIELIIFQDNYVQSAHLLIEGSSVNIQAFRDDEIKDRYIVEKIERAA